MSNTYRNGIIFETVDPLSQIVYLTSDRWETKITKKHIELLGEEKLIRTSVEQPISIYIDKERQMTHIYFFEHGDIVLKPYGKYLKVAVDRELQGQIKTAYFTDKGYERTQIIYP